MKVLVTYVLFTVVPNAVAQLVEALPYKSKGREFDSDGVFEIVHSFKLRPHCDPRVDSPCNRNDYQGSPLAVKLASTYGWQPCHIHVPIAWKSWEAQIPGALGAYLGLYSDTFTFIFVPKDLNSANFLVSVLASNTVSLYHGFVFHFVIKKMSQTPPRSSERYTIILFV